MPSDPEQMLIKPMTARSEFRIADVDPGDTMGLDKSAAKELSRKSGKELAELQDLMYAAQQTPVLIILQGLDTSGKDGTIQHVLGFVNPQSCSVASYKAPTPVEAAHDFLWRVHASTPARGNMVIFNRSHYEDVLVVRVHKLVPQQEWERRFDAINDFERLLAGNNTIIMKFFLHISKEEQAIRLKDRETDPTKAWKLSAADWKERSYWNAYQQAYQDVIRRCSTTDAPWYVVPANHKWFRNAAIGQAVVARLQPMRDSWMQTLEKLGHERLKEIRASRRTGGH